MKIRKLFKFEAAHIVRNCSSVRCRQNIHGHSFKVELILKSDMLDNAGMVMDFGLLKGRVSAFFDTFDHSYIIWSGDKSELVEFIRRENERWIGLPFSPSAENLATFFHVIVQDILSGTPPVNGQSLVKVHSVRVHETDTGWAETEPDDTALFEAMSSMLPDCTFSPGILEENKDWEQAWHSIKETSSQK